WVKMDSFQRQVFLAKNPGPAAIFFDEVIKAFIRIILKYNPTSDASGLFGKCTAYYAMIEAQGRGTLHCHMLIWLAGNPSPQELRDRMAADSNYKCAMFQWLESIISCELPSTKEVVKELNGPIPPPKMPSDWIDPRLHKKPDVRTMSENEFQAAFLTTVEDLVIKSNWHVHKPTCWKYLKVGQPHNDSTCRMRIDGSVHPVTHLDPETESIILRRLHPRINNFNQLVMFLLRCNMDIKYIGSGEAAKALIYYVTDYITKSQVTTHVGLSALEYAIKRNNEKFEGTEHAVTDLGKVNRSLFTKTVMALMSKQEISHQQVMSYLIGGGDYYSSHTFKTVKWGEIDRQAADNLSVEVPEDEENEDNAEYTVHEDEVTLVVSENYVGVSLQVLDYPCRSHDPVFNALSLWEHEEWVTKVSLSSEEKRNERAELAEAQKVLMAHDTGRDRRKCITLRGRLDNQHPQASSHVARLRRSPLVNVLLGETIPRPDRRPEEKEKWARAMLILFKPWRKASDLRDDNESWISAFERTEFSQEAKKVMKNMLVEYECKDARDAYTALRKAGKV
ncbi:hypothetical protein R3P38DRAFT_2417563, partial [Favolaschia claudopus]